MRTGEIPDVGCSRYGKECDAIGGKVFREWNEVTLNNLQIT
jgi:hypothetical protein